MFRKTTAVLTVAALLLPLVAQAAGDSSVPVPAEHRWDGQQGLYEPRVAFLAELNRWTNYWDTLFPADKEAPTSGIKTLGEELTEFKRTASSGMTVADLKKSKAAFANWQNLFSVEFCALPGVAESGQDCGAAAHQIRSAALTSSPSVQRNEQARIAALAAVIGATNGDGLFDNGYARAVVASPPSAFSPTLEAPAAVAAPAPAARRGLVYSAPVSKPTPVYVPPPYSAAAQSTDPSLVDRLVRAIKRAAPWEWDEKCLTYVWEALTATLKENIHAVLGTAAHSAHNVIAAVRRTPDLLARLNLHAVNPFDSDGRAHLEKGMTIFYDRGVCGFNPEYGHSEIVTEVAPDGSSGRATSSNVENVRTACLSRALKRGLAMVVMPGPAASTPAPASL